MKNNTKVRLHLSKHLFEALTRQVIAESKGNMGGGAYTETVKAPKSGKIKEVDAMSDTKKMKKMDEMETNVAEKMHGDEKKVIIKLDEFVEGGPNDLVNIGEWAFENVPKLAKALTDSGITDRREQAHSLGGIIVGLITVGSIGVTTGLAMYANDIKKLAHKLKNAIKGEKEAVTEMDGDDSELAALVDKLSDEMKAKVK